MDDKTATEVLTAIRGVMQQPEVADHAIQAIETLAWFKAREPYFRALVGAVEDAGVFRDEAQDEWRQLVDWEMENRKP